MTWVTQIPSLTCITSLWLWWARITRTPQLKRSVGGCGKIGGKKLERFHPKCGAKSNERKEDEKGKDLIDLHTFGDNKPSQFSLEKGKLNETQTITRPSGWDAGMMPHAHPAASPFRSDRRCTQSFKLSQGRDWNVRRILSTQHYCTIPGGPKFQFWAKSNDIQILLLSLARLREF